MVMAQTAAPKKASGRTTTVKASDVQELKDALAAQQQQIQQLMQQMQTRDAALQQAQQQLQQAQQQLQQAQSAATDAQAKAAAAQTAATSQQDAFTKLNSDMEDVKANMTNSALSAQDEQKRVSALEALVGRFRFNGDVRVRGESFFQDFSGFQDRNRARVRARFGFEGKLNEDFSAGFALATGSLGDSTTSNETLTNFFDRKTIGLDKAYITYNPVAHPWISATGGKFPYLWQRTSVTGDPDLNPEGFDVKLSYNSTNKVFKGVSAQALTYLFNEVSSGADSYALGGQVQGKFQYGFWTATPSFLAIRWNNPSAVLQASAFAVQATKGGFTYPTSIPGGAGGTNQTFNTPGEGPGCAGGSVGGGAVPPFNTLPAFPNCAYAPNGMTNAVTIGPDGKTPRLLSGFFYADFILNNQFKTGIDRFPVNLLVEYEQNLAAADHPLDFNGNVATNLGSQNKEYGVDVSVGQTKNKNDIQIGYAWLRQEQDSVLASFAESDQRAPTNIIQNRFYALWKIRANTVASFTWWHGRTLNTFLQNNAALSSKSIITPGQEEPSLNRLQSDLIYTF
jgi:hypothetical protein